MHRWRTVSSAVLVLVMAAALLPVSAGATSLLSRTTVELIDLAEYIVAGEVLAVTDGFDANGVPYTEITLAVNEELKGTVGAQYTFRQFGLTKPRQLPNGQTYLGISPDGWPRFRTGEKVLVFLYKAGAATGLRTTVGLMQGKFTLGPNGYTNAIDNRGLFHRVRVEAGLLDAAETKMLRSSRGPVPAESFRSFVRKTVQGGWIQRGRVTRVK